MPAGQAVSEILSSRDISAGDGTLFTSSLAMADAFSHARECLRVVEDLRPQRLDPDTRYSLLLPSLRWVSFDNLRDLSPGFFLPNRDGSRPAASATILAGPVPDGSTFGESP